MTAPTDSPRWCSTCVSWGDHHTDRHITQPFEFSWVSKRPSEWSEDERAWVAHLVTGGCRKIVVLSIVVALLILRDIRALAVMNRNTREITKAFKVVHERIQKLERTR